MSTLKQPLFRYYRNSEFLQYMKDVLELISRYDVSLLQLTEQRNALATSIQELETKTVAEATAKWINFS